MSSITKKCSIKKCKYKQSDFRRGMCGAHYAKFRRNGNPLHLENKRVRRCTVVDCKTREQNKRANYGWFCQAHFNLHRKYGTPYAHTVHKPQLYIQRGELTYIVIKDKTGKVKGLVKIDTSKKSLVEKHMWAINGSGYAMAEIGGKKVSLHHFVYGKNTMLDHKDRNRLNNTLDNLRIASPSQNVANSNMKPGISGYRGVIWLKKERVWVARCTKDGKVYESRSFNSKEDAAMAYNALAKKLHKEFSFQNRIA